MTAPTDSILMPKGRSGRSRTGGPSAWLARPRAVSRSRKALALVILIAAIVLALTWI